MKDRFFELLDKSINPMTNWQEEFDEKFPTPDDHPRMSKCACISDEEHYMYFNWTADPDEVKAFISSTLSSQKKLIVEALEKLNVKYGAWSESTDAIAEAIKLIEEI